MPGLPDDGVREPCGRRATPSSPARRRHVVGQMVAIAPAWYPIGGRTWLGMEPGAASARSAGDF